MPFQRNYRGWLVHSQRSRVGYNMLLLAEQFGVGLVHSQRSRAGLQHYVPLEHVDEFSKKAPEELNVVVHGEAKRNPGLK